MAKPVRLGKGRDFTFTFGGGGAVVSKYPWDEWFNGDLLMLERSDVESTGEKNDKGKLKINVTHKRDYDVDTAAMGPKIKTAARKRFKVVQVSFRDADGKKLNDAVIIRARDMTAEERQAEDIKRAEEKEAHKSGESDVPAPTEQTNVA